MRSVDRLAWLEMDGFVRREVHATKPPKVEYSLAPLGCELAAHVQALLNFVHKDAARVLKSRENAQEREPVRRSLDLRRYSLDGDNF